MLFRIQHKKTSAPKTVTDASKQNEKPTLNKSLDNENKDSKDLFKSGLLKFIDFFARAILPEW